MTFSLQATLTPKLEEQTDALLEFADQMRLRVLNEGAALTCVKNEGGSIMDVIFATESLVRRMQWWLVDCAAETSSDHRYIRFEIHKETGPAMQQIRSATV